MSARQQPLRNLLHLLTVVAAPWVLLVSGGMRFVLPAGMLALAGLVDLARVLGGRSLVDRLLPGVYRHPEPLGLSGATMLAAGYLAATLLFPPAAATAGIVAAALGDPAAAVVGRRYGGFGDEHGKTWVGSLACFLASGAGLLPLPGVGVAPAVAGAAMATLVERRSGHLDNLLTPVAVAMLMDLWVP